MIVSVSFQNYTSSYDVGDTHCIRIQGSENCDWFSVPDDIKEQMEQKACETFDNGLSVVLESTVPAYW